MQRDGGESWRGLRFLGAGAAALRANCREAFAEPSMFRGRRLRILSAVRRFVWSATLLVSPVAWGQQVPTPCFPPDVEVARSYWLLRDTATRGVFHWGVTVAIRQGTMYVAHQANPYSGEWWREPVCQSSTAQASPEGAVAIFPHPSGEGEYRIVIDRDGEVVFKGRWNTLSGSTSVPSGMVSEIQSLGPAAERSGAGGAARSAGGGTDR